LYNCITFVLLNQIIMEIIDRKNLTEISRREVKFKEVVSIEIKEIFVPPYCYFKTKRNGKEILVSVEGHFRLKTIHHRFLEKI